jgi:hypothetical protein
LLGATGIIQGNQQATLAEIFYAAAKGFDVIDAKNCINRNAVPRVSPFIQSFILITTAGIPFFAV